MDTYSAFIIFLLMSLGSSFKVEDDVVKNYGISNYPWEENRIEAVESSDENNEISEGKTLLEKESGNIEKRLDQINDIPLGTPDEEKNVPGEPLTPEDFANALHAEELAPPMDENSPDPIESAGLFEGDIVGVNISDIMMSGNGRNAIRDMNKMWPGAVVPYAISSDFNSYERSVIAAAFQDYHSLTCIRFVPRTQQPNFVYFVRGSGCSSSVGRQDSGQRVTLGQGCFLKAIVIHELMHAIGFWHEQSRADRDEHVMVYWQNIRPGMEFNFQKFGWDISQSLGAPYDPGSVMHYGSRAFSRDNVSPTILPRQPGVEIGQRRGFSNIDLKKINSLYRCGSTLEVKPPVTKPTIPEDKCTNNHQFCEYWGGLGECAKNPNWMLVNCKKACNQCAKKCNNYNKDCEYWAKIGECTKNPSYMTIYCARSCNTCHLTQSDNNKCMDHNKYCSDWAQDNQCAANPNYMLRYCRLSCKHC